MQTPLNLWLWQYRSTRPRYAGYHLKADKVACRLLIDRINAQEFAKASFSLRPVPENMPRILAPEAVKFVQFDTWRLRRDEPIQGLWQSRRSDDNVLDTVLNSAGIERLSEGFGYMLDGQWDYAIEDIWFWGEPTI